MANIPSFVMKVEELIRTLSESHQQKDKEVTTSQNDYLEAKKQLDVLKQNNQLIAKYLKAVQELDELLKTKQEFDNKVQQIAIKEEIDGLTPLYKHHKQLFDGLNKEETSLKEIKEKLKELETLEKTLLEQKELYEKHKESLISLNTTLATLEDINLQRIALIKEKESVEQKDQEFEKTYQEYKEFEKKYNEIKERFFASISASLANLYKISLLLSIK